LRDEWSADALVLVDGAPADHRPPGNPSRRSFSRRKQAMTCMTGMPD
jgi:hypothetical protein